MSSILTTTVLPSDKQLEYVASKMYKRARRGVFEGRIEELHSDYVRRCMRVAYGTKLMLTRDVGHHTSGWLKNPDYERCWHLSLSPSPIGATDYDRALERRWVAAFFRDKQRMVWREPSSSKMGRDAMVTHWRLFCDERWIPIVPRKEVYSTEFTQRGWKTASEVFSLEE